MHTSLEVNCTFAVVKILIRLIPLQIVDKHLGILAKKHLEAKFVKINAEKCPFLTERLRIKVIPTIMLVKVVLDLHSRDT